MRGFQRSRGAFWIAVVTVALGAGGATAVFSVVDFAIFLTFIGDRLTCFGMKAPIGAGEFRGFSPLPPVQLRCSKPMGAIGRVSECGLNERDSMRLTCAEVTASFLPAQIWRADPNAVGRTLVIDGRSSRIIGVLPPDFEMPTLARVDLLLPAQTGS